MGLSVWILLFTLVLRLKQTLKVNEAASSKTKQLNRFMLLSYTLMVRVRVDSRHTADSNSSRYQRLYQYPAHQVETVGLVSVRIRILLFTLVLRLKQTLK
jgi:hypothetical protein